MHQIWKKILTSASDLLPDFNDKLLVDFRKNKINEVKNYLDSLFSEIVKNFGTQLKYIGWEELTPDERLQYIKDNKIIKQKIEIQYSTFELIKFKFEFEGAIYPAYIHIPYMEDHCIVYQDTKYFPLLPIIERGGLHRTAHDIIIKVMRAPILFKRNLTFTFRTIENPCNYKESVPVVRIHQRKHTKESTGKGKNNKKNTDRTPLILYHLVKYPFYDILKMYGFEPDEMTLEKEIIPSEDYQHVFIREGIYLRIKNSVFDDTFKRRFIASYLSCLVEYPKFDFRDLIAPHLEYYKAVLGKFTYPASMNGQLLRDNAVKHLETTDSLLDPPARYQLTKVGINVNNIYDLLLVAFFNLDNWIVGYDPTNLYEKKIGSLEQIMAPLVAQVNSKLFKIINNKRVGLTHDTLSDFVKSISLHANWLTKNIVFRANPSICNDNWLLAIGANKFRSLDNIENAATNVKGSKGKKGTKKIPKYLLKAHPSQLVVESILCIPPSNPIVSGTINPYLQIDEDGNIIKPDWADEIEHVFD